MIRSASARAAAILVALASISPAGAHAQSAERGFFVGAGGGMALMDEPRADFSRVRGSLHLRAGWSLGPSTALVIEGGMNGIGAAGPDSTFMDVIGPADGPYYAYYRRTLETRSLLASVQLGGPSFYVRPGVGVAWQGFLAQRPLANDGVVEEMRWEAGPALSLAAGRVAPIPGFPLNVEGVVFWSGSEDGTNPRWSAGVQVARVIHF